MALGMRVSVVSQNLKSPTKPLLDLALQRVVVVIRIVAKIIEGRVPAELGKIGPALVGRQPIRKTDDRRCILIVIRAAIDGHVGTLIADVAGLYRDRTRELMLDGRIPRVHGWQTHFLRIHPSAHAIGIKVVPVRSGRLAIQNRSWVQRRRPYRQVEHALPGIGRIEALYAQHGQVLRDAVAEDRTKGAYIESTPVAHPHHGLGADLVGDTRAWS